MAVEILCVGHASFDVSVMVDAFPLENSKCEIRDLRESGGGPAANAAYLLSSWGIHCGFVGLVGDDRYGRIVRDEFQSVGTDVSLLESRPGYATPYSVILINKRNGSRTIVNRKLAGCSLELEDTGLAGMSPRVLLFDGHELSASRSALRAFPDAISILDAGSWRDGTAGLAGEVDYLAASERFALQATGLPDLETDENRRACVGRLREKFSAVIVVTMGEHGLVADDGGGFFHLPAYPAEAVDTTAAGDIFHGAFAYAVLRGMPLRDSLRFASLTASISVRSPGGRSSIPALALVKEDFTHAE